MHMPPSDTCFLMYMRLYSLSETLWALQQNAADQVAQRQQKFIFHSPEDGGLRLGCQHSPVRATLLVLTQGGATGHKRLSSSCGIPAQGALVPLGRLPPGPPGDLVSKCHLSIRFQMGIWGNTCRPWRSYAAFPIMSQLHHPLCFIYFSSWKKG